MTERNSLMLMQHREGILSAYLYEGLLEEKAHESLEWSDEPRKGVEWLWSEEPAEIRLMKVGQPESLRSIKILDSFFSDTLIGNDIRIPIFNRVLRGVPVKFLLADPKGGFGIARAKAIGQSATIRSMEGLQRLARACNEVRSRAGGWKSRETEIVACKSEDDWERIAHILAEVTEGLPVEVRLYEDSPAGPLYFFSDLLFAGRFWVESTAAYLPWEHIIDTPFPNDLFNIMLRDFHAIWDKATPLMDVVRGRPASAPPYVFISCCMADEGVAGDLKRRFEEVDVEAFVFSSDLRAGEQWSPKLRDDLRKCDALVAILSGAAIANSDWIRAEIGAAWVLNKLIVQANVGVNPQVLPGILDHRWAKNIADDKGKNELVADILSNFKWRPNIRVSSRVN